MLKKIKFLIVFTLLLLCTSCFEIIEEVTMNDDGSGSVTLTLNLSRSKTRLNSIMLMDSINKHKVPSKSEIRSKITEAVAKIKEIQGIYNVQHTENFDDYIFTISCDFNDVDALNSVIANFSSNKNASAIKRQKHFSYNTSQKTFRRSHHYNFANEFKKTNMEDRKVFETASFTSIYRFDRPIASSENKAAKISGSKKAIMLRLNAQDIIKNRKSIKNQIQLLN